MATSKKPSENFDAMVNKAKESSASANPDAVEEAEVIEESPAEATEQAEEPADQVEVTEPEAESEPEPEPVAEDMATDPVPPPPPLAPPPPPAKSGGMFGTVLGGAIAAAIGFGVATYTNIGGSDAGTSGAIADLTAKVDGQAGQIDGLGAQLSNLSDQLEGGGASAAVAGVTDQLSALDDRLSTALSDLDGKIGSVSQSLTTLDARLTEIEKRPVTEAPDISGAVEAYERELEAVRSEIAAQRQLNAEMASAAEQAAADATAAIESAQSKAATLEARAATMQIRAAIDTGAPFASAIASFSGTDVPPALSAVAETGAPTIAQLGASFVVAAREALDASLRAEAGENPSERFTAFIRTQVGARSLEPRDGSDPDAVLSRAEAAVKSGALTDAIAELQALPEAGQAAMAGWIAQAESRLAAVQALSQLTNALAQE